MSFIVERSSDSILLDRGIMIELFRGYIAIKDWTPPTNGIKMTENLLLKIRLNS